MKCAAAPGVWLSLALFAAAIVPTASFAHDEKGHKLAEGPAPIVSAKSGAWSAGATWQGGKVPGEGARVLVASGHTVTYDVASDD